MSIVHVVVTDGMDIRSEVDSDAIALPRSVGAAVDAKVLVGVAGGVALCMPAMLTGATAPPVAAVQYNGMFFRSTTAPTALWVCLQNSGGAYAWVQVAAGT